MNRLASSVLIVLLLALWGWSIYSVTTGQGWPHEVYCWGKVDNLDPFCP